MGRRDGGNFFKPSPYLHRRLSVGVEGGFEAELSDADRLEEGLDHADQVLEREVMVGHEALHLVEFTQMGVVHRLVAEHAVDREVPGRFKRSRLSWLRSVNVWEWAYVVGIGVQAPQRRRIATVEAGLGRRCCRGCYERYRA